MNDPRIQELLDLASAEGLPLPYPAETIAALEGAGAVVDLTTGAIIAGGANVRYSLTVLGEANAIVCNVNWSSSGEVSNHA